MEFGKVPSNRLSKIDFNIPSQDPRTWLRFRLHAEKRCGLRVGIGCPVWSVKDWLGEIYPSHIAPKDYLFYYSRQFNSIELNSSHYRVPDQETVKRWRDTVPNDFRFNPKLPQEVSHRLPLSADSPEFRDFIRNMMLLEDKLGMSFLQLPPHFDPGSLPDLRRFLRLIPHDFPIAVEVRHPALFSENMLIDPLYDILSSAGAHSVITDVAGRRDVLHTSLTSLKVMVRFVGNDLHPTDHSRIQSWVNRLQNWFELGLEQVEFFVHEPQDKNVPHLIAHFIDLLNEECELRLRKWKPEKTNQQLELFS